ncbi:hypothetical protein LC612_37260 [Nostoc sp. CHAB 5834]|nr:hypothetical protein [Nostoc sp. CHAB 5834]
MIKSLYNLNWAVRHHRTKTLFSGNNYGATSFAMPTFGNALCVRRAQPSLNEDKSNLLNERLLSNKPW